MTLIEQEYGMTFIMGSGQPLELDVELLLQGGLVIDAAEPIPGRVVSQRVGRARIIHIPQLDEDLERARDPTPFGL